MIIFSHLWYHGAKRRKTEQKCALQYFAGLCFGSTYSRPITVGELVRGSAEDCGIAAALPRLFRRLQYHCGRDKQNIKRRGWAATRVCLELQKRREAGKMSCPAQLSFVGQAKSASPIYHSPQHELAKASCSIQQVQPKSSPGCRIEEDVKADTAQQGDMDASQVSIELTANICTRTNFGDNHDEDDGDQDITDVESKSDDDEDDDDDDRNLSGIDSVDEEENHGLGTNVQDLSLIHI